MKKFKTLVLLPLLASLVACSENEEINVQENIINKILEGVNVQITGNETITYPEELAYLNQVTPISINRDYRIITEEDGKKTSAMRENYETSSMTFFKGSQGQAIYEVYSADNKVEQVNYKILGMDVLYNEYFSNPFDFIDYTDIAEDYSLSLKKASLIIENYTGYQYAVKDAKFFVEDNVATSLNLELFDRIDGIESAGKIIDVTNELELDIKFNYDLKNSIEHLKPREEADEELKTAFNNQNNYTMKFSCDSISDTCMVYVTEEAVYIHNNVNTIGVQDGDEYYLKTGKDKYAKYEYSSTTSKFFVKEFEVSSSSFLPNLTQLSPNILARESEGVYLFDQYSAKYGMEKMLLPKFAVVSGIGVQGSLTITDGHFTTLYAQFSETNPVTITQNYSNYGTTSMPKWLDVSSIS